jgi:outer membrane protein assembly factor BamB
LLLADAGRLVLAARSRIFALACSDGAQLWQIGRESAPDPRTDPESSLAWTNFCSADDLLYCASDHGDLICVDPNEGAIRWHSRTAARVLVQPTADRRFVCCAFRQGERDAIAVFDAALGKQRRMLSVPGDTPLHALHLVNEDALLVVTSQSIWAFEPATGGLRWRVVTTGRFLPSTFRVHGAAMLVSDDYQSIASYDLASGRVLWRTPPLGKGRGSGLWGEVAGGFLYVTSGSVLAAFDLAAVQASPDSAPADGGFLRPAWQVSDAAALATYPPLAAGGLIVIASPVRPERVVEGERAPASASSQSAERYVIKAYGQTDGREAELAEGARLVTEPLSNFGGMYLRENALVLLDGNRLIGYVGETD